jgi:tRNA(fMet)-specific endonuclease VapC
MNGNYLLDTNIIIGLFANDAEIIRRIQQASRTVVSAVVIGELYYGAYNSTKVEDNLLKVEQLARDVEIIACDSETSGLYGYVKSQLKKKGKPIPENDIWIAAAAKQHQLTLVSRDKHFGEIDGLDWIEW